MKKEHDWISVSVPSFGFAQRAQVTGLYTIGDAAAFVDPFTGSGMLMAMESAECLAHCVEQFGVENATLMPAYDRAYRARFASRLRVSGVIRHVAYEPSLSRVAVKLLSMSRKVRAAVARRTRSTRAADGL
jgi:flavin-dependent dehydrogenase